MCLFVCPLFVLVLCCVVLCVLVFVSVWFRERRPLYRDCEPQLPFTPSPFLSRKETGATSVCVCDTVAALCVCVCLSGRTSSLIHIILNRIFPSRVLLPPSFRSLPQDSRFSRKSAASLRTHCLFWSIIVPEVQKQ